MADLTHGARAGIFKKEEWELIFLFFMTSVLNAIYEIGIIKEFSVTACSVQTSAYIFFAFLHIFFGVGSYIAYRFFPVLIKQNNIKRILFSLSLSILLSLFFNLRLSVDSIKSLVAGIAFVCASFTLIGIIYGLVVIYFSKNKSRYVGFLLLSSNVGIILGFALEPHLAVHVGVNAVCLIVGISFLFLFRVPYYAFFLIISVLINMVTSFPLDKNIENLRLKRSVFLSKYRAIDTNDNLTDFKEVFNGWSQYTKLNIFSNLVGNKIKGAYNYEILWRKQNYKDKGRRMPFEFIEEDDSILEIGVGAGRDADRLPPNMAIGKENVVLVEIDPSVVKFFKEDHPEYNNNLFNIATVIAGDGRTVLDETRTKKDVIDIGTLKSSASNLWMLNELKSYVFTTESLKRCFEILNPEGVLVTYQPDLLHVNIVCSSLEKLEIPFRIFKLRSSPNRGFGKYFIYASRSQSKLERICARLINSDQKEESVFIDKSVIITDDRPFVNFVSPQRGEILRVLSAILLAILAVITVLLVFITNWKKGKLFYFFLIGSGFFLVQLMMFSKFRSFFSHPLKTIVIVNAIFLFSAGIGNMLSHKIKIDSLKERMWPHLFAAVTFLLLFYFSITNIPFAVSNFYLKMLVSLFAIFPIGLFCGFYYPLGLLANRSKNLGYALLFDGIGACSAFIIFYLVNGLFGITANFYPVLFMYLLATLLISV
jgi:spermidine synthase